MWPKGFDPASLTRDASHNKLVVGAAPGAQPAHLGLRGGDLLGRDTVVSLVRQRCATDVDPGAVTDWLVAAVAAEPAGAAAAVVDEVGDRLASLIATLRDPGHRYGGDGRPAQLPRGVAEPRPGHARWRPHEGRRRGEGGGPRRCRARPVE